MKLEHRGNCIIVKYIPDRDEADGMFDYENGKIYIRSKLSPLVRECTYLHELTHKRCYQKKCPCFDSDYLCEYHAMRGTLQQVVKRGSRLLLRVYLQTAEEDLLRYQSNPEWKAHLAAMRRLMKTKAFKEAKRAK